MDRQTASREPNAASIRANLGVGVDIVGPDMKEGDIAATGAEFKARIRELFGFLVAEFGFEAPVDESGAQAHRLTYRSLPRNQLVEVLNAFHGVDYGFEITLHPATGQRLLDDRNMIYCRLKEDQDADLSYLVEAADCLRAALR